MAKKEEKAIKENKVKKHFVKDFKAELKKVIWPTPKQLTNNTTAVVAIVVIIGVIVFALDVIFEAGQEHLIAPAQSYIVEKFGEDEKATETKKEDEDKNTTSENESTEDNSEADSENSTESNQ